MDGGKEDTTYIYLPAGLYRLGSIEAGNTMIQQNEPTSWAMRKWPQCWRDHFGQPSETVRHYYHIFLAIILFSLAQLLTCAWDQPFWMYDVDFPGQIAAMVFVWLAMWAIQVIFFRSGEGLEGLYHRHLRAPVSY